MLLRDIALRGKHDVLDKVDLVFVPGLTSTATSGCGPINTQSSVPGRCFLFSPTGNIPSRAFSWDDASRPCRRGSSRSRFRSGLAPSKPS